ncbi:hypothetical protein N8303_06280 [Gammaproteobacteria bacterium]|jgi:hypothetical protein|nr:hypothetical protein [Gammaproteobacteria bacterium]
MSPIIKKFSLGLALFAITSSIGLAQDRPIGGANCTNPAVPIIPSDAGQDLDALLDAQDAVQAYMADSNTFIDCVNTIIERRADSAGASNINAWTDLINANVDAQESIGAAFNEQVQIYRASSD